MKDNKNIGAAFFLGWAVIFLIALVEGSFGGTKTVKSLIHELQQTYDSIHTIRANFEQTYRSIRFDPKTSEGKVILAKPGKMRWEYKKPKGRVLVADGTKITLYDPEDGQALISPQPKEGGLPLGLSFLIGGARLEDSFVCKFFLDSKMKNEEETSLQCKPKEPDPNFKEMYFTLQRKKEKLLVVATRIIDALDGENEIRFSKLDVNLKISPRRFDFSPPEDVPVVSMSAGDIKMQ